MTTAEELHRELVAGLVEGGVLASAWRPAMEQVARHRFIPDTVWTHNRDAEDADLLPLRRQGDPERWLAMAYANDPVFTQVDDGHPDEQGRGREVTSSASMPAVVAQMLDAVEAEPGMRVLEIGTGTGYNAALLAHRLGAENVVSVEVDAVVAGHARARLTAEGYGKVTVATGDGAEGWADGAPYDRVLATVAARQVPPAWVAQTRPGGLVLVPWGTEWHPSGLLRLEVDADGVGRGRVVGPANFMVLREQRVDRWVSDVLGIGEIVHSTTDLHPWYVTSLDQLGATTAVGFRVPGGKQFYRDDGDGPGRLHVVDLASRSWARVLISEAAPYPVEQSGPRRLWDEVTSAHQWWREHGEPSADDWLVTVGPAGQRVELAAEALP